MNYNKFKQQARQGGVPRINLAGATSATNANQTTPRDSGTVQTNAIKQKLLLLVCGLTM